MALANANENGNVPLISLLANTKQGRLDRWAMLRDAVNRAETSSGEPRAAHVKAALGVLRELRPYEGLWLYPGDTRLDRAQELLEADDVGRAASQIRTMARLLAEHGDEAAILEEDGAGSGGEATRAYGAERMRGRHYFTVLFVDTLPAKEVASMRRALHEIRAASPDLVYEILVVSSLEQAIVAALNNDDIQAVVMASDFPLRSGEPFPIERHSVRELIDHAVDDETPRCTILAQQLRRMRPHLDLYLVSDESFIGEHMQTANLWSRVFYKYESLHELHVTILAGVRARFVTPFFDSLRHYADRPVGNFHALPIARGHSIFDSKWIRDMADFYGTNIFMAESSATTGGLDSLLEPHGPMKEAMDLASRAFGSQHTFYVTNGTSTANKIVGQAVARPGDIILIDHNCHKSHHYGLVMSGAHPLYLEAYKVDRFALYGGVPLAEIKHTLHELERAGRLDAVKALVLTNCTMDGIVYNPMKVMEEILAIKPDMIFFWDEAWYAFAGFHPLARTRTAMFSARELSKKFHSAAYRSQWEEWKRSTRGHVSDGEKRMVDPDRVRIRVYATQSTHKSLSAFRQGSMIHVYDDDFERYVAEPFEEAFFTHTSTSPNYQIIASLDIARRQMELEGFSRMQAIYQQALRLRCQAHEEPLVQRWLRLLDASDFVPEEFRQSGLDSFMTLGNDADLLERAWADDEFVLDPTRMTCFTGAAGIDGDTFKSKVLMDRYGIQVNETSMNRVLLNVTIGVTWGSLSYLLDVLRREAEAIDEMFVHASTDERRVLEARIARVTQLPALPDFGGFHDAYRASTVTSEGDMRAAYFAAYDTSKCEHIPLSDALDMVLGGRALVSTRFVVPYPPGFPVLVPGQLVSAEIIDFLLGLSIKEIHGYRADLGLSVFTQEALDEIVSPEESVREHRSRHLLHAPMHH